VKKGTTRVLSDLDRVLLILVFAVTTVLVIELASGPGVSRADLLLLATSSGTVVAALFWLFLLALGSSRTWLWVMGLGIWVPYVNLVLASVFARRHWDTGARTPALLGIAGLTGQTLASLRLLLPVLPSLV
jgi:hypothetical protein